MALRSPRFSGDPTLEACQAGTHRMHQPEQGLAVKRVQEGLVALGRSVGSDGADGKFGQFTGAAVSAYKADSGLQPTDPVVGTGTISALDADLFVDPPTLDPAFKEFAPAVASRRAEPFVGLELATLIGSPLDSWRHMVGRFTLGKLDSDELLGIVARSRSGDLRDAYVTVAAPVQGGQSAEQLFDDTAATLGDASAVTLNFETVEGSTSSLILLGDQVVLGWATVLRPGVGRAPSTLRADLFHELNHVRNTINGQALRRTPDTDSGTYVDTALAQASSALGGPTVAVMAGFVEEMSARHMEWIAVQETLGNATAPRFLQPEPFVEAVRFYVEETRLFHGNGYVPGILAQGESATLLQIALWLRRCQEMEFSDDKEEDVRTRTLFGDAAQVAEQHSAQPPPVRPPADGLSPLTRDFVLPE
ncbi:hypothetical protein JCM4814A_92720 [Streptomyces phaeofaciens JCM 4814]|uniref:Peptidoglycan binding-like domain-containing protein n=1 Tax=Streptomyces phaeofaciens TaxID=68254 RepID=A0A918HKD4_9ACTN|nr:peptidoglycan-binding domain-containing protein [Streptomyces phaeofaciens]GGT70947.1 hypothetical protein GCM10010226_56060 [Streptomyces phaeofaciens]